MISAADFNRLGSQLEGDEVRLNNDHMKKVSELVS